MQNHYVKALAIKTYQEQPRLECSRVTRLTFHTPSFLIGMLPAVLMIVFS